MKDYPMSERCDCGAEITGKWAGKHELGCAAIIPLNDLPLYWQGRANAFRIIDAARTQSDAATLEAANAYEECANELGAALAAPGTT